MAKIKSHKTPEQIAKKHGVSVSSIQKQLNIGIPIEHEHTKDKDLATDIALQHLGEFPDYYTRLKKMEKSAKNIKEAHEESRFCPLCDKREKRSECSYGENAWDKVSVKDEEYSMARSELKTIDDAVQKLMMKVGKGEGKLEAWVQSKITRAADYIDTAADYVAGGEMEESFTINPAAHKVATKRRKIEALTTSSNSNEASVAKAKLGKTTELPKIKKEERLVDKIIGEEKKKMKGKNPCWKGYEMVGTKNKSGKEVPNCVPKESVTIQDANGNDYIEFIDIITPEPLISEATTRLQAQTGNLIAVILSWKGKTYSLTMFFPQVKMPSRKEVEYELQKVYPGSKVLQFNVTTVRGDQPIIQVQNTKSKNYLLNNKTIGEEVELNEISDGKVKAVRNAREKQWNKQFGKKRVQDPTDDMVDKVDKLIDQRNKRTGSKVKKTTMGQLRDKYTKNRLGEEVEIDEGLDMKTFKANRKKAKAAATRTDAVKRGHVGKEWYNSGRRYSPDEAKISRANMDDEERRTRHRSAVDPDNEDDNNYSADKTKNPKKLRKQKAMGEVSEAKNDSYLETDMKKRQKNNEKAIVDMKKTKGYADMVKAARKHFGEEVEISEAKKSEMPCNQPKAQAHGSGETGKSHVVKACEGGKEKLIRFGQLGVKGSPKKEGESKEYASRRHRFQTRHAKNISKGKMSAAYWANKVKW
jgi:hypothetical protein